MNKSELIGKVAETTGKSLAQAREALDAVLGAVGAELADGGEVRLAGFGNFTRVERPSRVGRNPRTGIAVAIPARRHVKFAPGAPLLARVQ